MSNKNMFFSSAGGGISPYLANLVAYWKFDSNSNDFSGNGHNGTDTSISYSNAGKVGNSSTFSGGTNRITISQSTDFDFSNVSNDLPFSLSVWAKSNTSGVNQWLFTKRNGSGAQYDILFSGGYFYIYLYTNTSNYIFARTNTQITNGVWNNFVVTYNGSGINTGIKIYMNGLIGSGNSYGSAGSYTKMPIFSMPFLIGNENFTGSYVVPLNGALDEVYIWKNRELTSSDALDIYNNGNSGLTLI